MSEGFRGKTYFLSNFYKHSYYLPNLQAMVLSSEHGFNAMKTTDIEEQSWVLAASTPNEAKRRGRKVTLRPDWDSGYRIEAMRLNLEAKFEDPKLRKALLATGDDTLVEYNTWHDNYWGICTCSKHGVNSNGVNMLGKLLMEERTRLTKLAAKENS